MEFTAMQTAGAAILAALGPALIAYLKTGGMNDLVMELQEQAAKVTADMRINPDGSITISATTAPIFLEGYEKAEQITGKQIVNRPEVGWIKAAETSDMVPETWSEPVVVKEGRFRTGEILYEKEGYRVRLNPSEFVSHLQDDEVYQILTPRNEHYSMEKTVCDYLMGDSPDAIAWRKRHP